MLQLREYQLHRPAVRHVPRQLQVVDGHVGGERIDDDLHGLAQREALLVLAPADVDKVEAVGGDGRGVHGAELVLADSPCPLAEEVHPVLLRDGLRQAGDGGAGQPALRRSLHLALPLGQVVVGEVVQERVISHREDVVHNLRVAAEHRLQVLAHPRPLSDLVEELRRAVLAVDVVRLVGDAAAGLLLAQAARAAQVPAGGEDELAALGGRGEEKILPRMELVLVIHRSPMLVRICLLAVLAKCVLLGGGVAVLAVGMYDYLVCGVRFCRSSFCHSQSIYGYKCT